MSKFETCQETKKRLDPLTIRELKALGAHYSSELAPKCRGNDMDNILLLLGCLCEIRDALTSKLPCVTEGELAHVED